MARLIYGTNEFIRFNNENELYETIGMLTKGDYSELRIEYNDLSGAWSKEGRIYINSSPEKFLNPISDRFTSGIGNNILYRVNCNEFVIYLIENHEFSLVPTTTGKTAKVIPPEYEVGLSKVPHEYQEDFDRGYNK